MQRRLEEMVVIWNEVCGDVLPQAQSKIDPTRLAKLRHRFINEMGSSIDTWRQFCRRVRAAPHLTGRSQAEWRANLDWCLKPENMRKVIEGHYDPPTRQPGRSYAGGL
jgi:hypothetical protein